MESSLSSSLPRRGGAKTTKKKKAVTRKIVRGQKCRALLGKCTGVCLNHPVGVILFQSFLLAIGLMCSLFACISAPPGRWMWPFLNFLTALAPLIPLFLCGGANKIAEITENARTRGGDEDIDTDNWPSVGWFILGTTIIPPFANPIILAQSQVVPPYVVWLSAVGAWFLIAVVIFSIAFFIKLSHHGQRDPNQLYYEEEEENDADEEENDEL